MAEISREALLIYLDNIRTLETIVRESEQQTIKINQRYSADEMRLITNISEPSKPTGSFDYPMPKIASGIALIILGIIIFIVNMIVEGWLWVGIGLALICIFSGIFKISEGKDINENNKSYRRALALYEIERKNYNAEFAEAAAKIHDIRKKADKHIADIDKDKEEIKEMLKQAYSANIIPLQFRNIQGVFYLYDYLSTSSQSLSDALMQCNLDAIKQKLNELIDLQSEAIVQQAQANAALYEQNQRILETAQATMENTAVAAKYAQISAVNSQLALKMQKKQLAYQRLDFWTS